MSTLSPGRPPDVPWNAPEHHDGVKSIAVQRVAAVPVLAGVGLLHDSHHAGALLLLAAVALLVELWELRRIYSDRWADLPLPALLVLDIGMVALAIGLTGGWASPIAFVGLLTLFPATYAFSARYMAGICAWTWLTFGGVVLVDALADDEPARIGIYALTLAFATLLSVNAARVREQTSFALRELAASRRRLVVDAAQLEASDRRRISQTLHDQALQVMLSAQQDLTEVAAGDPAALQYARDALYSGLTAVREVIYDIDPAALAGSRLPEALQALVERIAQDERILLGSSIALDASGPHDELLHAVARELLRQATESPGVRRVAIELRRADDVVHLSVADDGPPPDAGAYPEGPAGVASAAARLDAVGGTLTSFPQEHGGTRVAVAVADARPLSR